MATPVLACSSLSRPNRAFSDSSLRNSPFCPQAPSARSACYLLRPPIGTRSIAGPIINLFGLAIFCNGWINHFVVPLPTISLTFFFHSASPGRLISFLSGFSFVHWDAAHVNELMLGQTKKRANSSQKDKRVEKREVAEDVTNSRCSLIWYF